MQKNLSQSRLRNLVTTSISTDRGGNQDEECNLKGMIVDLNRKNE